MKNNDLTYQDIHTVGTVGAQHLLAASKRLTEDQVFIAQERYRTLRILEKCLQRLRFWEYGMRRYLPLLIVLLPAAGAVGYWQADTLLALWRWANLTDVHACIFFAMIAVLLLGSMFDTGRILWLFFRDPDKYRIKTIEFVQETATADDYKKKAVTYFLQAKLIKSDTSVLPASDVLELCRQEGFDINAKSLGDLLTTLFEKKRTNKGACYFAKFRQKDEKHIHHNSSNEKLRKVVTKFFEPSNQTYMLFEPIFNLVKSKGYTCSERSLRMVLKKIGASKRLAKEGNRTVYYLTMKHATSD